MSDSETATIKILPFLSVTQSELEPRSVTNMVEMAVGQQLQVWLTADKLHWDTEGDWCVFKLSSNCYVLAPCFPCEPSQTLGMFSARS